MNRPIIKRARLPVVSIQNRYTRVPERRVNPQNTHVLMRQKTEHQENATGGAEYPLVAPQGGKEPLQAQYSAYTMGSDHDVYQDSSFKIPAIYLNDWPDRYIHTNFDTAANIDPTKLKRAAFIGAASGYVLANAGRQEWLETTILQGHELRKSQSEPLLWNLSNDEACNFYRENLAYEKAVAESTQPFTGESSIRVVNDAAVRCEGPPRKSTGKNCRKSSSSKKETKHRW